MKTLLKVLAAACACACAALLLRLAAEVMGSCSHRYIEVGEE